MKVSKGKTVSIDYKVSLAESGELIDETRDSNFFSYTQGEGQVIPGLEKALEGKEVGSEVNVTIQPEDGYGYPDEKNLIQVPIQELPPDLPKKVGTQVQMQTPDNRIYTGTIVAVEAETITIDFNHPLAGKALNFWVKIVDVK